MPHLVRRAGNGPHRDHTPLCPVGREYFSRSQSWSGRARIEILPVESTVTHEQFGVIARWQLL